MKRIKKLAAVLLAVMMLIGIAGCGNGADAVDSLIQQVTEDETVRSVKNGHPEAYPDITYGEAFGMFFSSPSWRHFTGTRNGPDEDGDGEPDYVEDDVDIVEFTGNCLYSGTEVKALIQFEVYEETFEAVYLSFNDVPQNRLMLNSLILKAFESANSENATEYDEEEPEEEDVEENFEEGDEGGLEDGEYGDFSATGRINTHGGIVSGYKTSYVVDGGKRAKVRSKLGNGWHVTAVRYCYSHKIVWYELYDSDDGDYYGWVDGNYIDFD